MRERQERELAAPFGLVRWHCAGCLQSLKDTLKPALASAIGPSALAQQRLVCSGCGNRDQPVAQCIYAQCTLLFSFPSWERAEADVPVSFFMLARFRICGTDLTNLADLPKPDVLLSERLP